MRRTAAPASGLGVPKPAKLACNRQLREAVEEKLEAWWSPVQISGWLIDTYPDDGEMRVSHETIYQSLFIQGKGALRHELFQCLRTGRAIRRPQHRPKSTKGQIRDKVMISDRPAEVEDRAVPGHWEGDLLMGRRQTAIGTLVERWSRYVMLFPLPDGNTRRSRPGRPSGHCATSPRPSVEILDVGSGQRDGPTCAVHRRHRGPGLLL